jgi:hypothetical protein
MATGYGQDTWCADSIVTGRYARGKMNVILAFYRRLITPRGKLRGLGNNTNEDELAYGFDLAELCGEVGPETAVKIAPGRIQSELLKDDRAADVFVTALPPVYAPNGGASLFFEVGGILQDDGEDFQFTVKVEGVKTSLLLGGAES